MSFRNVCTTSFLYAKTDDVKKLESILNEEFRWVHSHMTDKGGNTSHGWFTMMERDLDDQTMEKEWMDKIVERLQNVIQHSWNLTVAWENWDHEKTNYPIKGYLSEIK